MWSLKNHLIALLNLHIATYILRLVHILANADPLLKTQDALVALPRDINISATGDYDRAELQKLTEFRQQHRKTVDGALCAAAFVRNGRTFTDCTNTEAPDGTAGREWCYIEVQLLGTGFRDWDFCGDVVDYDVLRAKAGTLANVKAIELANGVDHLAKEERRLISTLSRYEHVCGKGSDSYHEDIEKLHASLIGIERAIEQLEANTLHVEQLRGKLNLLHEQLETSRKSCLRGHKNCALVRGYHQPDVGDGVVASYYDNPYFRGTPKGFLNHANVNLIWDDYVGVDGVDVGSFSVRLETFLRAPVTDVYTFYIKADCNFRLFLDNEEIISEGFESKNKFDVEFGPVSTLPLDGRSTCNVYLHSRPIRILGGGRYYLVLEYSHQEVLKPFNHNVAKVILSWSRLQKPHVHVIPPQYFFRSREDASYSLHISGLKGQFHNVGILENGACAFKQSPYLVLADVPQKFGGATMIASAVTGIAETLRFDISRDAFVYVAQPDAAIDIPKQVDGTPFEKTADKLSIYAVGEHCHEEAAKQHQFSIYVGRFKAGSVESSLPAATSLLVFAMPTLAFGTCRGNVEYLPFTATARATARATTTAPLESNVIEDTCTASTSSSDSTSCINGFGSGTWETAVGKVYGQYILRHFGSMIELHHFHFVPAGGNPPTIVQLQFPDGDTETFEIGEGLRFELSKPRVVDWVKINIVNVADSEGAVETTGGSFALYGISCKAAPNEPIPTTIAVEMGCGVEQLEKYRNEYPHALHAHHTRVDVGEPKSNHGKIFYGWDTENKCSGNIRRGIQMGSHHWSLDLAQHGVYSVEIVVGSTNVHYPISLEMNGFEIFGDEYLDLHEFVTVSLR